MSSPGMGPLPPHAWTTIVSSIWLWHGCERRDMSGFLDLICVARPWSDVLISHRYMLL